MTSSDAKSIAGTGVSVITPTYNAGRTIVRTIESVAAQTYGVMEHIVIDDGSSDNTVAIVRSLTARYSHLKLIEGARNSGAGAARNRGIEAAQGKYIAFLDSDDVWFPNKLEQQIGFMERNSVCFSYGDYLVVDAESRKVVGHYDVPESLTHSDLLRRCPIGCLTAAYDQYALGKVYMPDVRRGQDWGLWLAITKRGVTARKYPGLAAVYQYRTGSLSRNKLRKMADMYRIYRREQGLGTLQSACYLLAHAFHIARKRPSPIDTLEGDARLILGASAQWWVDDNTTP